MTLASHEGSLRLLFFKVPAFSFPHFCEKLLALGFPLVEIDPVSQVVTLPSGHASVVITGGYPQHVLVFDSTSVAQWVLLRYLAKVVNHTWPGFSRVPDCNHEPCVGKMLPQQRHVRGQRKRTAYIGFVFRGPVVVDRTNEARFDKFHLPIVYGVRFLAELAVIR